MKNVFYFWHINIIGGIETFFYEMVKKYSDSHDITIIYKTGDKEQINRLKQYVRVKKYTGETIECEKCFFNFNLEIIDNVKAKEYIQIIHGDYKAMGIKPNTHPKITKYICVSKIAAESLKELTNNDSKVIYNPITVEEPKKVLFLLSATRLSKEKGKERMIKLSNMLNEANIPYLWLVFTNDTNAIDNPNIAYMKPRLDIRGYIAKADYLVQLSDNEGYCYSVVEALSLGTPVIVTDMPVMKEIGVNENNGFILDFNLSNVDVKEIYNKEFNFKYNPPKEEWNKELIKSKSTYKEELEKMKKIKALQNYTDTELKRNIVIGEEYIVDNERAEEITNYIFKGNPIAEVIEDIKEEVKEIIEDKEVEKMVEETKKKPTKKKTTTKKKVVKK